MTTLAPSEFFASNSNTTPTNQMPIYLDNTLRESVTTFATYDEHIEFLTNRYGDHYHRLTPTQKSGVGKALLHALGEIDEGEGADTAWSTAIDIHACTLPTGFQFKGLTGNNLERMLRVQLQAIAAQFAT